MNRRRDAKGILHLERISNTELVLSYERRKGTGARFSIQEADLLTTWTAIEGLEESVTPVNDLSESVSLSLSPSQNTGFYRLHVTQ